MENIMLFGLNIHASEDFDGNDSYESDIHLGDVSIHISGADPERVAMMLVAIEEYTDFMYPDINWH
jgi:hypothetical protein